MKPVTVFCAYPTGSAPVLLPNNGVLAGVGISNLMEIAMFTFKSFLLSVCLATMASASAAKPPLRDVAEVDNGLLWIGIADEIRKQCGHIDGRVVKAVNEMYRLRARANSLGYSDDEIRAYVNSQAEKDRMRAKGEAYLAAKGVSFGNPDSFCSLGRKEIQRNSAIGVYLRAK